MIREALRALLAQALHTVAAQRTLTLPGIIEPPLQRTRERRLGQFASTLALQLGRQLGQPPRALAEALVAALPENPWLERVEIAGPGFINFFLTAAAERAVVPEIRRLGKAYGRGARGAGQRVLVEFVSANPNGPLHVGHGRGAAYGSVLAELLAAAGYAVEREYYINDAGRQMDILAVSVWLRYLELAGIALPFPAGGYQGDYVWDIAADLHRAEGTALARPAADVARDLPADEADGGDKDAHVDGLIARAKELLGAAAYRRLVDRGLDTMTAVIRRDLAEFGVHYEGWFSERRLHEQGAVAATIERLRAAGQVYEQDGALWFRASDFGDEKDRVLRRENGQYTYFAADIAYHDDKFARGYDRMIDIWGADHHGYVPRVKAALAALGHDAERLAVLLMQFAVLYRGGQKVQMSTRSGEFVTLRELRAEVGNDAARFFYVMRRADQHLDFDLDLARAQSNDKPVYYVQYAHARICSVFRQLAEKGLDYDPAAGDAALDRLTQAHETALLDRLARYPELIEDAAAVCEPHQLAQYLRELAQELHVYYNAHQFLVADAPLRAARLNLVAAVRQVLANGLGILKIAAPETM